MKRYIATITLYAYDKNPKGALKHARLLCKELNAEYDCRAEVERLHENNFASAVVTEIDLITLKPKA